MASKNRQTDKMMDKVKTNRQIDRQKDRLRQGDCIQINLPICANICKRKSLRARGNVKNAYFRQDHWDTGQVYLLVQTTYCQQNIYKITSNHIFFN